ncbi:unnamed protein product [Urochloa humidicola]
MPSRRRRSATPSSGSVEKARVPARGRRAPWQGFGSIRQNPIPSVPSRGGRGAPPHRGLTRGRAGRSMGGGPLEDVKLLPRRRRSGILNPRPLPCLRPDPDPGELGIEVLSFISKIELGSKVSSSRRKGENPMVNGDHVPKEDINLTYCKLKVWKQFDSPG